LASSRGFTAPLWDLARMQNWALRAKLDVVRLQIRALAFSRGFTPLSRTRLGDGTSVTTIRALAFSKAPLQALIIIKALAVLYSPNPNYLKT